MAPDLTFDPAQARMDDIAVDRLVERIGREAARHVDAHKSDLRAEALAAAAADLRARAGLIRSSHGEEPDPLALAIWESCRRDPVAPLVLDDPRTITQVAYEAVADLLDPSAAEVTGQHRTEPEQAGARRNNPEHPGTEANHA
ncbi:hypothetical protein ACQP2T_63830 (plasmid) [Nonomuraea sp. CA-143628]|uniref:hypothetical protein n=1 Tax=Nonomuraea sp. CA-143628 TaxID=3239997 RepID=UPI003D90AC6E